MKVYGESDAVKTFLDRLNSHFKVIILESFDYFKEFSKTPDIAIQQVEDDFYKYISEIEEDIAQTKVDLKEAYDSIQNINANLKKKYYTVKKVYGPLKREIQDVMRHVL